MNNSLPRPRAAARHANFRPPYPFRETVRISDTPSRYAELSSGEGKREGVRPRVRLREQRAIGDGIGIHPSPPPARRPVLP